MQTLQGLTGLRRVPPGTVLSVGNFDGLHRGHDQLLRRAAAIRQEGAASGVAVVTFEPHPLTVLRPALAPPRLTPPALKQSLLSKAGVDHLVILAPTPEVLNLTAEAFWAILRDEVRPAHMIEGPSFTFGKARGGNIQKLKQWAAASNVTLDVQEPVTVPLLNLQIVEVSSSLIRWLLSHGRVRDAAICLGRPYVLEGVVVKGHQRGKTIGVPTANLDCGDQMVPGDGVYAGRVSLGATHYPAAVSIGTMPTFGQNRLQVEAHLVGFEGDLYGKTLHIELLDWLREQQKYPGIDALKAQLARDISEASHLESIDATRAIASA
jgi:riboflavin kinase/FMN adenylyltransferase